MQNYKPRISGTSHIEMDPLVRRMTDGLGSNKYKSVDYDRLRATISEKRFGSIKNSMKVAKIEQASQLHKENTVLKQHQLIWHKEFLRLQHLRKKAQADVDSHMRNNRENEICSKIYNDFDYFDAGLSADFDAFKKATADPVWNLRDDLRYWLTENREEVKLGSPDIIENHAQVREMVHEVKAQQQDVLDKLISEQRRLEAELQSDALMALCPPLLEKHVVVQRGIPDEALELDCPDKKLKADVLQEFLILDSKHADQIDELERRHALALSTDQYGDWDPEEHFQFIAIHDQYPRELPNRRTLLFDRLKRHLPKKTRSQLSDHEDWWMDYKYFYERLKGIYADWARDRRELYAKVQMVFSEAAAAQELEEVRNEYYNRQKQLCEVLYEKVKDWREKKLESMKLRAEINEEKRKQVEEQMAREKEAEKKKRMKQKEEIDKYNKVKEADRLERQAAAEKRLQELMEEMAEQAVYDKERVHYREQQLTMKLEERKQKQIEKEHSEEEKEARLEALRAQVRIIAESNPLRTMQDTKAWIAHHNDEDNEEIPITQPLFDVHTYTSKQITSDHRVRLEQKLREAGLHNTDYARQIIRGATPPQKPRKDLQHTFKFED